MKDLIMKIQMEITNIRNTMIYEKIRLEEREKETFKQINLLENILAEIQKKSEVV